MTYEHETTNALIAEARRHTAPFAYDRNLAARLADALEASEAMRQEYLNETVRMLGCLQHIYDTTTDASLKAYTEKAIISDEWPAILLEAVRHIWNCEAPSRDLSCYGCLDARATLVRYKLLKEAAHAST